VGLVNFAMPAIVMVLADLGFKPSTLGAFSSADTLGFAAGGLAAIAVMRYVSPRVTVAMGLALLFAADLASASFSASSILVTLRSLGAFGGGLAMGACAYVYGLDPERNTAAAVLSSYGLGVIAMTAIPAIVWRWDWHAMFIGLALTAIAVLGFSRYFPSSYRSETTQKQSPSRTSSVPRVLPWLGFGATALFAVALSSFWTYLGRIGSASGLGEQTVSRSLSFAASFGLLAAGLMILAGKRLATKLTIALCAIITAAAVAAAHSPVPWVFAASISVFNFSTAIYVVAAFGLLMRRAPTERFAVQIVGVNAAAAALGPALGGVLIESYGFGVFQLLVMVVFILAAALLWRYSSMGRELVSIESQQSVAGLV